MTAPVYEYSVEMAVMKADGSKAVMTYVGYAYSPADACLQAAIWVCAENAGASLERAISVARAPEDCIGATWCPTCDQRLAGSPDSTYVRDVPRKEA